VLLRREGWKVNEKRTYRIYCEEGLSVRTKVRKKRGSHLRVVPAAATMANERWAMDFVHDQLYPVRSELLDQLREAGIRVGDAPRRTARAYADVQAELRYIDADEDFLDGHKFPPLMTAQETLARPPLPHPN